MLNIKLEERITVDQIIKFIPLEILQTVRRIQAEPQLKLMLKNSKICKINKEKMFLLNTLGEKLFETTLLYQTEKLD